ncbi:hypothetical protein C2845_PM01G08260 [Panicum miliaceum]|uniref:Uncharacterized protein n=1 Tax=Panicum miliaceum TaxID=4540 RepID=A0A3L6TIZ2_PANMI|nr:hypothetical protein C2845_PM01G08260 [Panicum miliaceum]
MTFCCCLLQLSQLLSNSGTAAVTDEPLNLATCHLILLPINDAQEYVPSEEHVDCGNHWSLLVIDNTSGSPRFIHQDNAGDLNLVAAHRLVTTLQEGFLDTFGAAPVIEADTPKQTNSSDCEIICRWWAIHHNDGDSPSWILDVFACVSGEAIAKMRKKMLQDIAKKAKNNL